MKETKYAEECLKQLVSGASVERVPRSANQTPDLHVNFGGVRYLIEEKEKLDALEYLQQRSAVLAADDIHENSVPLVRNNTLSGLVRDATRQLSGFASEPIEFRLIWFTATGARAEGKYHQFIATVLGTTNIFDLNVPGLRKCYFFRNSDFHRYAAILDGVVAAFVSGSALTAKLCLNPISPRYDAMRESPLAHAFGTAVLDPRVEEAEGVAYILDSDIDRNNETGLLSYLRKKYKTGPLQKFDMGYLSAEVRVRASNEITQ
jgi:hypothetical protein